VEDSWPLVAGVGGDWQVIVRCGSRSPELHALLMRLYDAASVQLTPEAMAGMRVLCFDYSELSELGA